MEIRYLSLVLNDNFRNSIRSIALHKNKKLKQVNTIRELKTTLERSRRYIVLLGNVEDHSPYEICHELSIQFPTLHIILIVNDIEIDYRRAMISGATDIISTATNEEVIEQTLEKVEANLKLKIQTGSQEEWGDDKKAKVITVCSTKGGVGKTTLSVNLSVGLAKLGLKVVVIDLDLQFGDVTLMFDAQPKNTIYEWIKEAYKTTNDDVEPYITEHNTGVDIIAAPLLPEYAELVAGEHVTALVEKLREVYDVIVIDTPPAFVETSLTSLEISELILLVTSLDLPALKNGKLAIDTLKILGLTDKMKIILNRDAEIQGMTIELVEEVLDRGIDIKIPSDYMTVISAINKGVPYIVDAPKSPVAKATMTLSEKVVNDWGEFENEQIEDKKTEKRKGFFSFIKSK